MIIAIEGGDACGKYTQAELLKDRLLAEAKAPVQFLSFPRYDTPVGAVISKILKGGLRLVDTANRVSDFSEALVLQCLMTADKYDAVSGSGDLGAIFVCDRWWQSAFVYGASDGLDPGWLGSVHSRLPDAYLNILLDVPVDVAMARRPVPRDKYEASESKRIDVRNRYLDLWKHRSSEFWPVIYGADSVASVHRQIWEAVMGCGVGVST